jgi:hypothetical protein
MFARNRPTPLRRLPVARYLSAGAPGDTGRGVGQRVPVITR